MAPPIEIGNQNVLNAYPSSTRYGMLKRPPPESHHKVLKGPLYELHNSLVNLSESPPTLVKKPPSKSKHTLFKKASSEPHDSLLDSSPSESHNNSLNNTPSDSHGSLLKRPHYVYPVKWVQLDDDPNLSDAVFVNKNCYVSRLLHSISDKPVAIVSPFEKGSLNLEDSRRKREILIDTQTRTDWKEFTTDFYPESVNAIKANYGIKNWHGPFIYVGKWNLGNQVNKIGTIYRDRVKSSWKFCDDEGNDIEVENNSCWVLCDKLSISEAIAALGDVPMF
ncbi:hypothetical protein Ocin01_19755 [Orchesella cincta]|uniref:Uncharacterized protein n=1 Tax=Orchesella cincta TaxID=48709 RepID=A0A1D2M1U3_ORCCI|nr:hypothetical protein Ocin01_19755 [Orchesella cincta]